MTSPGGPGSSIRVAPATVEQLLHGLIGTVRDLAEGWSARESTIAGLERAIGNDLLGAAFHGVYDREVAMVKDAARTVPELLLRRAELVTRTVLQYGELDHGSATDLQGTQDTV